MEANKKVEKLIAMKVKEINLTEKEYESLREETKKLAQLNNVKIRRG